MSHTTPRGIELRIDGDGNVATLILQPDVDPASLTVEALSQLIRERRVVVGDDLAMSLEGIIEKFRSHPATIEAIIAEGTPPVHGIDGRIEWQPGCDPRGTGPAETCDASATRIDFYSQAQYVSVIAGSHLATIHAATPGTDGHDVTGRVRKAKPGAAVQIKSDASARIEDDGRVIALISGVLRFENNTLSIRPLFEVPNSVDFSTGNIFFKGSVTIRGDVRDRFIVHAEEDLTVGGLIGGATVICGRNLHAQCGMAAHQHGCLFVGADAAVGYLKNVHGLVQGNLVARRELINCDLAVNRNLVCDAGAVIGGSIAVNGSAVIGTLGSAKGTVTSLAFGSHPCQGQIDELLQQNAGSNLLSAERLSDRLCDIARQIRACADQACNFVVGRDCPVNLTVTRVLHPGVVIRTGRARLVIHRGLNGPIYITGDQQSGLFYRMGDGVTHPLADLCDPLKRAG